MFIIFSDAFKDTVVVQKIALQFQMMKTLSKLKWGGRPFYSELCGRWS